MIDPVNHKGDEVSCEPTPFMMEVTSKESYANFEGPFNLAQKRKLILPQYSWLLSAEARAKNDGGEYYVIVTEPDYDTQHELDNSIKEHFSAFLDYVKNHNAYVEKMFNKEAYGNSDDDAADARLAEAMDEGNDDGFMTIEGEVVEDQAA